MTAEIAEKTIERTLRGVEVTIEGVGEGLAARAGEKSSTVQLTGAYSFIESLAREDVHLYVDAGGLEAGRHTLPVQIRIDNAQAFTCALSAPEITVTITESEK